MLLPLSRLKPLSQQDFAEFGRTAMAYVKRVDATGAYAIHAADGTYLWRYADREVAFAALRQHEMEPMSVH